MRAAWDHAHAGERPALGRPRPARAPGTSLLASVGNRGVAHLLRHSGALLARKVGWDGAVTDGYGWNVGERPVGKIRRIPLQLPGHGLTKDAPVPELTPERADHRAIVLVPDSLDATQVVDYVVFLHGYTENPATRPYAGYRAFKPPPPKPGDTKPHVPTKVDKWRQGIDDKDVAPVRDVALDQTAQQLEDSGLTQLVIVLPQGDQYSRFGDAGNAAQYVQMIAEELVADKVWLNPTRKPVTYPPRTGHIAMAGHSGAGATLGSMAENASVRIRHPGTKAADNPFALPPGGELVIFDAINGPNELNGYQDWVNARLDIDLRMLKSKPDDDAKLAYLDAAPKLRGFYTDGYRARYIALEQTIRDWFKLHAKELGPIARCLRANFILTYVGGEHEELMRGVGTGASRSAGILAALRDLHRPAWRSVADCPKMPEEIEEDERRERRKAPAGR